MSFAIRLPHLGQDLALTRRVLSASEVQTINDAQALLAQAQQEGAALLQAARDDIAAATAAAREQGYRDGLAQLHSLTLATEQRARQRLENLEDELVRLVLAGIRKLLPSLPLQRLPVDAAREALRALRGASALKIRVHPAALAQLSAEIDGWRAAWPTPVEIHAEADDSLNPYDALVESNLGTVHATLAAQLMALEAALRQACKQ